MPADVWYGNVQLSADFPLPELAASTTEGPVFLRVRSSTGSLPSPVSWVHHWLSDGDVALSVARFDGRYVVEFDDGSSFRFDPGTRIVSCPPMDPTVRHQLLDQVLPRVLEHLGHVMIHASAVRTPQGAVMFVADAGAGKSTLAASFQSAGIELLSDDCMQLTLDADAAVGCLPTYRSLRLWSDSADAIMANEPYESMSPGSDKRRLGLAHALPGARTAVAAICVLAPADDDAHEITFSQVAPARAVSLLVAQCFRLDPTDVTATNRTFDRCVDIVERVPIVELAYPRDYERLPEVRDAVMERGSTGEWPSAVPS